jgi:hypothetical protein
VGIPPLGRRAGGCTRARTNATLRAETIKARPPSQTQHKWLAGEADYWAVLAATPSAHSTQPSDDAVSPSVTTTPEDTANGGQEEHHLEGLGSNRATVRSLWARVRRWFRAVRHG